jgi:hypothetical protein
MRSVQIAPDVADLLGATQTARLASDAWDETVQCWDCGQPVLPGDPAAVLVICAVDAGASNLQFAVHTHPACAGSEVRRMTIAELRARPEFPDDTATSLDADLDVAATLWVRGDGSAYPAVFISFRAEVLLDAGDEPRDGVVAGLTAIGWHPTRTPDDVPPAAPAGWWIRFGVVDVEAGLGLLELINPAGQVETEARVQDALPWLAAVYRSGATAVFQGSRYLAPPVWLAEGTIAAARQAAHAGRLVGGTLPVHLHSTTAVR